MHFNGGPNSIDCSSIQSLWKSGSAHAARDADGLDSALVGRRAAKFKSAPPISMLSCLNEYGEIILLT